MPTLSNTCRLARSPSHRDPKGYVAALLSKPRDRELYALVSSQTVSSIGTSVFDAEVGQAVGKVFDIDDETRSIAVVLIGKQTRVVADEFLPNRGYYDGPLGHLIGSELKKISPSEGIGIGQVAAAYCEYDVKNFENGVMSRHQMGLEVVDLPSELSFAKPGDAGAPVFTKNNELVGMVVAGSGGSTYVAPVCFQLKRLQLKMATRSSILRHNEACTDVGDHSRVNAASVPISSGQASRFLVVRHFSKEVAHSPRYYRNPA